MARATFPLKWASVILLTLSLGILIGRLSMWVRMPSDIPTTVRPDVRETVPVVEIYGVRNGKVTGTAKGAVRLFLGEDLVIPDGSGAFAVVAPELLRNEVTVQVPAGMQFVASKKGKYFYRVDTAAGERIVPANRVYFPDSAAAERAGFLPGS
ncbi:MAG: hypothetical protein Q7R81_02705 [Candidatus Peregrinibacteria bacterium]|nr:hypothetical protein [Candidatus Peregrinibacteria bacterium]